MRRAVGCEGYAQLYGMGDGCVVGCVEMADTTERACRYNGREGHMRGWIVSGAACCALAVRQTAGPVTFDLHADAVTRPGSVTVGPAASVCWFGLWAAMRVCVVTSRVMRGVGAAAVSRVCTLSAVWHRVLGSGAMSGAVCGGPGSSRRRPAGQRAHMVGVGACISCMCA